MVHGDIERRLTLLEARIQALEARTDPPTQTSSSANAGDSLWVLDGMRNRLGPEEAGVVYAGRYRHPAGELLEWQIGRSQQALLNDDWSDLAPRLAALGSPVRLQILQALLQGITAVQELAARPGMGTSGQLYHHLRELEAAGWLHTPQRGTYALRPERVVPLMALLTAARQ